MQFLNINSYLRFYLYLSLVSRHFMAMLFRTKDRAGSSRAVELTKPEQVSISGSGRPTFISSHLHLPREFQTLISASSEI